MEANNNEVLRTALKHCIEELKPFCNGGCRRDEVLEEATAALALPRLNSEVGTAQERNSRFYGFCNSHFQPNDGGGSCVGCPIYKGRVVACQFAWENMPYDEKGAAK